MFSLLLLIGSYVVLYLFYFSLKDDLISDLVEDKRQVFILASDYTGFQSIEFLTVNEQTMSIISDILSKYMNNQLKTKKRLSQSSTINGIVFETNHFLNPSYYLSF